MQTQQQLQQLQQAVETLQKEKDEVEQECEEVSKKLNLELEEHQRAYEQQVWWTQQQHNQKWQLLSLFFAIFLRILMVE